MTAAELKKYYISDEFKKEFLYDGKDLGVTYNPNGSTFKVWAPTAKKVELNIYNYGSAMESDEKPQTFEMTRLEKGVYFYDASELGDLKNKFYTYSVTVDDTTNETNDVYSWAVGVNGTRTMIIDMADTNPEGFENDKKPVIKKSDITIYELHIKDFSSDPMSGISEAHRGKYLAFTEEDTWYKGDKETGLKTGVNYLKDLGVTHVHLLPSFDYGSIEESKDNDEFNWGYDPVNYNTPEGSYATSAFDGKVRINEFKQMVMALHKQGIGVIMDVVYNHTYNLDNSFHKTVPYYYHRLNEDGTLSDGSGCGNETASEHEMYRKFMIDSLMFWASEYHIDGFRFDLMGLHDTETMNEIRKALDTLPNGEEIIMYGEPWVAADTAMEEGYIPSVTANEEHLVNRIDIFSDSIRDAVKGSVFIEEEAGYVNSKDEDSKKFVDDLKKAITLPNRVTYESAHDNFTLYDKLVLSTDFVDKTDKENMYSRNEEVAKMNKLAADIIFTANGMAFIHAGEEFLRTKNGIGDSYNSSYKINRLDWTRAYNNQDIIAHYKELIALRKAYPEIANIDRKSKVEFVDISSENNNVVAFTINDKLMVIYNPNMTDLDISNIEYKKFILSEDKNNKIVKSKSMVVVEM